MDQLLTLAMDVGPLNVHLDAPRVAAVSPPLPSQRRPRHARGTGGTGVGLAEHVDEIIAEAYSCPTTGPSTFPLACHSTGAIEWTQLK